MIDLLVVGAGLSGLSAALTAAQSGMNVRVIAKGLGSMHWSAATVDLLGYLPETPDATVSHPHDAIEQLPSGHPYRLIDETVRRDVLTQFQTLVTDAGLVYVGANDADRNLLLPSPVGAYRPVYLAPIAQAYGNLETDQPILVVGFEGMRDFYPALIAENLRAQGHDARSAFLPLELLTKRHDSNTVHLAEALDAPAVCKNLSAALAALVKPGERIGLPAILGLNDHGRVMSALQDRCKTTVFEIPTLPPSVPGIRLHSLLRQQLLALGVRVEAGMEAIGFGDDGRRVTWVETETSARPLKHRATNFLLATGGVLGGGFSSDHNGRFWETIFDLPLTVDQDRRSWFKPEFLAEGGQPVFLGGVAVDSRFQPLSDAGETLYDNLWVAGGTLAHTDPIRERSLEGLSIVTGSAAAREIIRGF